MDTTLLEIDGLTKSYTTGFWRRGRLPVLDGVDLSVERGARVLLAGPNGSGKSTLLRILAGIEAADGGSAHLDGAALDGSYQPGLYAQTRIGYAPDGCPFPPELPARTMLQICAQLGGMGRREARKCADAMLARVGLASVAKRKLARLSKGMQRRFTLAQAFLGEPDLLLLDEPTDGLDAGGFGLLGELLDEARERGAGVLLASHVAALDCDRVHVLWQGRLVRSGSPAELLEVKGGLLRCYAELERDA